MKKSGLFAAALCAACMAQTRDLRKELWFFADFDQPARMDGNLFLWDSEEESRVPGKYGNAYYFHRPVRNNLPPMASFIPAATNFTAEGETKLTVTDGPVLRSSGGAFRVRPFPAGVSYSWIKPESGVTCSFYARGAPGTRLTLATELSPTNAAGIRAAKQWKWTPGNNVDDDTSPSSFTLAGDWQLVWTVARMDNRTASGREVGLTVTSSGPVEMNRFQYQPTGLYPFLGFYHPGKWVDGGRDSPGKILSLRDPERMAGFPVEEGACSFWVRTDTTDVPTNRPAVFWGYCRSWSENWGFTSGMFRTGPKSALHFGRNSIPRSAGWRHLAGVWKDGNVSVYVDGEPLAEQEKLAFDPMEARNGTFRVGGYADGSGPGDVILDEVAIFRTALSPDEIKGLYAAKTGLLDGVREVLAAPIDFTAFPRNQTNAALRMNVWAPAAGTYTLKTRVGGLAFPGQTLALEAGPGKLAVGFEPALFRPGAYPYAFELAAADGAPALVREGTLTVRPRLERDAFKFLSWGGNAAVHHPFAESIGVNTVNVGSGYLVEIRALVEDGFFPNIRYENANAWQTFDFDAEAIRAKAFRDLDFAAGLHAWSTTLVNSEVYGTWSAHRAKDFPAFIRTAREAIGCEPEFTFADAPSEVDFRRLGIPPLRGVIDPTNATLKTLSWYIDAGMPVYRVNAINRDVIRTLSPGNTVWTEPVYGPGGIAHAVDMMADWFYAHSVFSVLGGLRSAYSGVRPGRKGFMPTLSMYSSEITGRHPHRPGADGKGEPVTMGQSLDELIVKTWMSIGAVRADNLSMFSADSWEYGVSNALRYAAARTNAVNSIADPHAPPAYGAFMRERLFPAAELLRGIDTVRADLAILFPSEISYAGGFWWGHWHYGQSFFRSLTRQPFAYDVIGDHEFTPEILGRYTYLVCPMARVITADHDRTLARVAGKGTVIVLDSYAVNRYPNSVALTNLAYSAPGKGMEPFNDWIAEKADALAARAPAASTCDGTNGFTFVKEHDGVRYVMVLNDNRMSGGNTILTTFFTNAWYRPLGAPQTISTEIRGVADGAAVYEFHPSGARAAAAIGGGKAVVTAPYAAAEARVFCVYPRPLRKMTLALEGEAKAGSAATLRVRILDQSGARAPGRQIVRLTLTLPDGTTADESGRYTAERGEVRIPLRFARGDSSGTWLKPWKADAEELTSGLKKTLRFRLDR